LSLAEELLGSNEIFTRSFNLGDLSVRPRRHVAVLAGMGSRMLFERYCCSDARHPQEPHLLSAHASSKIFVTGACDES